MTSVTSSTYAEAKTGVFWDVEDCPIPEGLDPESVYRNIRSALANIGYRGEVLIRAYGDKNQIPDYYESAGIQIFPEGDKIARIRKMQMDFVGMVIENNLELSTLMVISREGMEMAFALKSWKNANHNILFANPEHAPRSSCNCKCEDPSANLSTHIWVWETLATGGYPISIQQDLLNNNDDNKLINKDSVSDDVFSSS